MAQVMGKQTIAEFVETDAILEKLRKLGVLSPYIALNTLAIVSP